MIKTTSEIVMKRMMKYPFGWLMLGLLISLPKTPGFGQCKVAVKVKPVNCEINTNGSITLEVSGGTAPYSFEWNNGSQDQDLDNLTEGTYQVKVTDSKAITTTKQIEVPVYTSVKGKVSVKPTSTQRTNDGSLSAEVSGGKAPYTFHWISLSQNDKIFPSDASITNLSQGNYLLIIQDANGCSTMVKTRLNSLDSAKK
jgi:hypothetical protein